MLFNKLIHAFSLQDELCKKTSKKHERILKK